jgi:hypothetical protein
MAHSSNRFEAIRGLEGLSVLGQQAVLDARVRLDVWIDENLDRIEAELRTSLESKRRALSAEVAGLQEEIAAAGSFMADILARLSTLEERFASGDGVTVEEAVRATRETILAVKSSLDQREKRVRGLARSMARATPRTLTGP